MSTDPIGTALTLDHPAVNAGASRIAYEQSSELTGIATAIERVEALLAAAGPEPEGSDAIERIADIAFVLHERDVEASLCDALDAAVRELGNANAAKQTNVQQVHQAAELLRELSQRVGDMIALLQVSRPTDANDPAANDATPEQCEIALAEPASVEALDSEIPREGLFTAETLEDDEFARAVAELAASLPALAEPVEAVVVTLREPADPATDESTLAPEPEDRVIEAQDQAVDLAASEALMASERAEAFFEAQSQPDEPAAEQPILQSGLEETAADTLAETQHGFAEPPADKPSLGQQPPAMHDAPVSQQAPAEELSIIEVEEPLAREDEILAPHAPAEDLKHDAIPDAVPANESALCERLSEHTHSGNADAPAQTADLPGDSPDRSSMNGPPVALADAEAFYLSPVAALNAQSELPLPDDAPAPVADAAAISAAQLSDQTMRCTGADEPAQIARDSLPHNADEVVAETAAELEEEPPPRDAESSQALLPELALVDPQDDPGDLFEPLTGAMPPSGAASELPIRATAMRARSPAAAADPLAAMRILGAEELLALFT